MDENTKEFDAWYQKNMERWKKLATPNIFISREAYFAGKKAAQQSVQRIAEHAADCAIYVGMLGECDCGEED